MRHTYKFSYKGLMKIAQTFSKDGKTFTLDPGQYPGMVVSSWNKQNPNNKITLAQLMAANKGVGDTSYIAGRSYNMPESAWSTQAPSPSTPSATSTPSTPATTPKSPPVRRWYHMGIGVNPGVRLVKDIVRNQTNDALRWAGLADEDTHVFKGKTITRLSKDQENWLRMAIQQKYGDKIPDKGSWGGRGNGRTTDDYRTYVHPNWNYAGQPATDNSKLGQFSNLLWRTKGVPNSIEYVLGDWAFTRDADGNIIVNDTYDFNVGQGRRQKGLYGDIRRRAESLATPHTDPDDTKTKFSINLGNPTNWPAFNQNDFRSFNTIYEKKYPGKFLQPTQ